MNAAVRMCIFCIILGCVLVILDGCRRNEQKPEVFSETPKDTTCSAAIDSVRYLVDLVLSDDRVDRSDIPALQQAEYVLMGVLAKPGCSDYEKSRARMWLDSVEMSMRALLEDLPSSGVMV